VEEAIWAWAVLDPAPHAWPGPLPPAVDGAGASAGSEPKPMDAAGLDGRQREAIRGIVCDMLIAAVSAPPTSVAAQGGNRRG